MIDPTIAYGALSYWHDSAPARHGSRQIEPGARYDVAIVGGGVTGLWTAYQLLAHGPTRSVALLEQEEVGFGSSGRCTGLVTTRMGRSLRQMLREYGSERALTLWRAGAETVQDAARIIETEQVECEFRSGQLFTIAASETEEQEIRRELAAAELIRLDSVGLLDSDDAQQVAGSPAYRLGMTETQCAYVHPLKLVRGLAVAAVHRGLALFERCGPAAVLDEGNKVRVDCPDGPVYAEQVVLATNAWAAHDPPFRRSVVPAYSYLIATEPLSDEMWARLGNNRWHSLQVKHRHTYFARKTLDGRIIWGRNGATTTFRSELGARRDRDEHMFRLLEASLAASFPPLGRVRLTHAWGGPTAVTPGGRPKLGSLSPRVHYGFGHGMHNLGPSFLAGRVLRDLVSGERTGVTAAVGVDSVPARHPPEPLRFLASQLRQFARAQ